MALRAVKDFLESAGETDPTSIHGFPGKFFDHLFTSCVQIDLMEPGRVLCSMKVPPRLVDAGNSLNGGVISTLVDIFGSAVIYTAGVRTSGVSLEINVSYFEAAFLDEMIEIEAKVLRVGKAIGVVSVELRKKETGKLVARGRHTKYFAVSSKL